jgi:lysophospholipase L1-like esterase
MPAPTGVPALPRRRGRLLVLLASPLVGLLLAELGLRAFGLRSPSRPEITGNLFRESDDSILLFENRPGAVKVFRYREHRGNPARVVEHRINADGFRGPLVARERTPGVARIACIGDSHTFGEGVAEDQTWPAHLARLLAEREPVEVLNCGVDAYDTLQEVVLLERRVVDYAPDLVLLQYYINDVTGRGLGGEEPPGLLLQLTAPHRKGWIGELRRRSWLVELVLDSVYRRGGATYYVDAQSELYGPTSPGWVRAREALVRARDFLAGRGIAFGVVLYPFLVEREGVLASHAAFEVVVRFCAEQGIPCLDAEHVFLGRDLDPLRVSAHDVHANGGAHALFAGAVVDWIDEYGWVAR